MDPLTAAVILLPVYWASTAARGMSAHMNDRDDPNLEKLRLRNENKPRTRGKTPGPARQYFQAVSAATWSRLGEHAEDKHNRHIQWFRSEDATNHRHEQWGAKQTKKLHRKRDKLERYKIKHGLMHPSERRGRNTGESPAPEQPEQTEQQQPTKSNEPLKVEFPKLDAAEGLKNSRQGQPEKPSAKESAQVLKEANQAATANKPGDPAPSTSTAPEPRKTPSTKGTTLIYSTEADDMRRRADNIESYREDLAGFADGLSADWGEEVHAPIRDMDNDLAEAAGTLRDLANEIQSQGDEAKSAYEKAPYTPSREKLGV